MASGFIRTSNRFWFNFEYSSKIIGSNFSLRDVFGIKFSILLIPWIAIFWVISTALVLQGEVIVFFGPTYTELISV